MSYTVTHPAFLDCQAEATGVHAAGTTTWTFTTPRPYNYALYKVTGASIALATADNLNFTASGNYSAGAAVLGFGYEFDLHLPRAIIRDERGIPEVGNRFNVRVANIAMMDTIKCDLVWRLNNENGVSENTNSETYTNESGVGSFGLPRYIVRPFWVMSDAERSFVRVSSPASYPWPVTVTGVEYVGNEVTFPR